MASLDNTRVMNLTEFGRAMHAEMEAISAAARLGVSTRGRILYSTTFPCHNCTRHIVGCGIERVVYIEPYPKSLGQHFHRDSISVEEQKDNHVRFQPFVGIAPRRYMDLFSMTSPDGIRTKRKDSFGKLLKPESHIRLSIPYTSSLDREKHAVQKLKELTVQKEET